MTEWTHVEHVFGDLLCKFREAHLADPESERTTLINGAILALEREWPVDCARYKMRFGAGVADGEAADK